MLTTLLPRHTPPLSLMLADLGHPKPAELARVLGYSRATVYRWRASDRAPRAVLLALFWATRWGRSEVECTAINDALMQAQLASCARSVAESRLQAIERLLSLGQFGSANDPLEGFPVRGNPRARLSVDVLTMPEPEQEPTETNPIILQRRPPRAATSGG